MRSLCPVDQLGSMASPPGTTHNDASTKVFLSWRYLTLKIPGAHGPPRYLLQNVTGYAEPGSLVAIMGPSGCGKTSLLNALAGRLDTSVAQSGEILTNGRRQQLSYGNSAYLTQDDSLIATLTVYETIVYSAHLQLPDTMTKFEKYGRVQRTIKEMGLQGCVNTKIGGWHVRGLSGGEKRRVSIAVEILKHPQLMFLDEPTSGLDSAAAYHVVKRLRALASAGRTLIASIHQPGSEVFELFDHLCLLSGGRTVFFGERPKAQQLFDDAGFPCPAFRNPSDHYLWVTNAGFEEADDTDVESGSAAAASQKVQRLIKAYGESETRKAVDLTIQEASKKEGSLLTGAEKVDFLKQTFYLTSRSFVNMRRDVTYYWFRLFVYTMLSICVGTIYYKVGHSYNAIQARAGMFTFLTAFLTFMGVVSFPSFIEDMKIFTRERLNGHYGVAAFVIANVLSSFPFVVLLSLVPGAILYSMGGLHPGFAHFFCFFLTLLAALSVVESLLRAIAGVVPDFLTGMIAGCGIMGMYLLNGGFFRLLGDLPKPVWRYPLSYMPFHTWTNRAFFNNDFRGLYFESNVAGGPLLAGEDLVRDRFQMDIPYSKWWAVFVLVAMSIVYRFIAFFALKLREKLPILIRNLKTGRPMLLEKAASGRFVAPHNDDDVEEL